MCGACTYHAACRVETEVKLFWDVSDFLNYSWLLTYYDKGSFDKYKQFSIKIYYFLWTLDPSYTLSCGTHFTRSLIIFALKGVPWQWKIRRREQWNDDFIFVRPVWMCFVHWHESIFNLQKSNDVFRKRIHAERCTPDVWSWLRISSSFNSVIIFSSNLMMWWFKKVYRSWNFRKLFHTIFDTI